MISANFVYRSKETESKKEEVLRMIQPVEQTIQKGEMIVRKGDVISVEQHRQLKKLRDTDRVEGRWMLFFVFAGLTGLITSSLYFVSSQHIRRFSTKLLHLETLAFLSLFMLVFGRVSLWLVGDELREMELISIWYLTPFAGGAMLVRMLINVETALVWMVYSSLLLLFQMEDQSLSVVYFLLSGLIALTALGVQKERLHLLRVGLQVGFVNSAVAILIYMGSLYFSDGYVHELRLPIVDIVLAFSGGVFSGFLALGLIPLFEFVGFVTDYRMQELSNRNLPLLQQLRRQSPGTYHHSMNMAALSEAAAEAIGANPLQARIACYYHDIGKSLRPQYFIENQRSGSNPHDRLTPEQSARIIMTHVIDGIALGQKYNLPQPIMDAIETHHGTSLIKYFYVRAVEEAGSKEDVDETLYRYQGRLPDTRESGIIFLADRVEAACRSLKDPSINAYRGMIQNLVNGAIAEGQLEECPLTIQEIYTIIRVFTETIVDIQHHRIEYPKLPEESEVVITLEVPNPLREQKEEVQDESG
jgi:putative nucleotidyltransferase with HDIG domain